MQGSLRIMHFGFLISVILAVLIIAQTLVASANKQNVECPCDFFESVPMTTGCWEPGSHSWRVNGRDGEGTCVTLRDDPNPPTGPLRLTRFDVHDATDRSPLCQIRVFNPIDCNDYTMLNIRHDDLTPEEVRACQCELLAYTTALNEGGIIIPGGPPYECGNVDCRPVILSPIPTLNEWGMIITAGVLGLLAVIGLFVMRRRKATA